jgi:uncharacterized protein YcbK (DUF882 family)
MEKTTSKSMILTSNFNLNEFRSKDGADFPLEVIDNIKILASNLQVLRDEIGVSLHINSGYRSPSHNKKIGGAKKSYHVKGMAADIQNSTHTPKQLFDIIERLQAEGKMHNGGLKAYATFVHYDIGPKRRW